MQSKSLTNSSNVTLKGIVSQDVHDLLKVLKNKTLAFSLATESNFALPFLYRILFKKYKLK